MSKKVLCLLLVLVFASGCARHAQLLSQPEGAMVEVNGVTVGVTPCSYDYSLSSGERYKMVLSKPGFKTLETEVVAERPDPAARKRWLAAGLVWSPLWIGALFTKRLEEEYLFVLEESPENLARYTP